MLNQHEIMQTIRMIDQQHLDVRTITMGISLQISKCLLFFRFTQRNRRSDGNPKLFRFLMNRRWC